MNIRDLLEKSIEAQRGGLLDIPEEVAEAIEIVARDVENGTAKGKAREETLEGLGVYVNVIPGRHEGFCCDTLITLCYDNDKIEERIKNSLDHAMIICPGKCRNVYIITTQWNSITYNKLYYGYLNSVRKNGVHITVIYITDKGITLLPV